MQTEELLAGLRVRDRWAWEEFYDSVAPELRAYVKRIGGRDPDDILGETMLQVVRDLPRFRGSASELRPWVFRIARNRVIDAGRRRARRPVEVDLDVEFDNNTADLPDLVSDPDPGAVGRVLDDLTDDQREAVWLRHVLDLSLDDTARIMNRDPGAVAALTHRGLRRLRRLLDKDS